MMQILSHKFNQWHTWQRYSFLFFLLILLYLLWYFCLDVSLQSNRKSIIAQQVQEQQLIKQLNTFSQMQENFVYQNDLGSVSFKALFQQSLSGLSDLSMRQFTAHPVVMLPAGAMQFAGLAKRMSINLLTGFRQSSASFVFSGKFDDFVQYLLVLQNAAQLVYFDSVDFNMNRYPNADITMKVFTLEK